MSIHPLFPSVNLACHRVHCWVFCRLLRKIVWLITRPKLVEVAVFKWLVYFMFHWPWMCWQQGWWSADEEAWAVCSERQGKWTILQLKLDTALKSQLASMIFYMCWLEIQNGDFQRLLITSRSLGMCHSTFLNPLVLIIYDLETNHDCSCLG